LSCEMDAYSAIKDKGLRVTAPRTQVLAALMHASGHVSAREVVRRVGDSWPEATPSTVYRSLSALRDARLISETLMDDGQTVYEASIHGSHHHARCRECGAVFDVPDQFLESLRRAVNSGLGFHAEIDHMAISGLCAVCRD
jgi:Fur family transcriptional regulator, ferric uptake regulator